MSQPWTQLALRDQVDALSRGTVTGRSLLRSTLEAAERADVHLNAFCATFEREAAAQMTTAASGRLAGVPVAVKDTFSLPWYAPRDGTPVAYHRPGKGESGLFRQLRAAGGVVTFATNMHQLGFGTTGHISAYGPCRNPWNPARCAGGSSSGSAAAVAARAVPLAIGTDAVGSVRIPASYCGITGLKPTWGAIPADGCSSASSMMAIGPMTRDAADCRLAAQALLSRPLHRERRRPRIGLPIQSYWTDLHPDVLTACREAVELLGGDGCELIEIDLPAPDGIPQMAATVLGADRLPRLESQWMATVLPSLHPTIQRALTASRTVPAEQIDRANTARDALRAELASVFDRVDVVAWPTVPTPPPPLSRPRVTLPSGEVSADIAAMRTTGLANLTGVPAVSIPCGTDRDGLPIGLMLHATWEAEAVLLDTAELLEELTERRFVDRMWAPAATTKGGRTDAREV